ncbi:MAG: ribonuclease D [Propionibacteriaceae bacterium]|jgi:ribonuclease D|nr:ribonuclease D [Propionibacteriaceae bacterium]
MGEDRNLNVLRVPTAGVPELIETTAALDSGIAALASGTGPVALDTERAQTFRYSSRAYLVQLRRAGTGTMLLDPIAFQDGRTPADLSRLAAAIADAEWILHSASQDLPCLAEIAMVPRNVFDTELAARLLGLPHVSLAALIEEFFDITLLKEHSAADWSRRPLPHPWLVYAALDVELLIELRDKLAAMLVEAGKDEWARQEFAYVVATFAREQPERPDRWRRLNGANRVRTRRGLAVLRELWSARDIIAEDLDRYPNHVLADTVITQIAELVSAEHPEVPTVSEIHRLPAFSRQQHQVFLVDWLAAIRRAGELPEAQLPPLRIRRSPVPEVRNWPRLKPEAAALWSRIRPAVIERAQQLRIPVENLVSPGALKQYCWKPPNQITPEAVNTTLAGLAVREWQRDFIVPILVS